MGVASCKWVLPDFTIPSFSASNFLKVFIKSSIAGKSLSSIATTAEICIAVGKVSFEDWLIFISSFGWQSFSPAIWLARFAITSFAFILDCVPEPVCQTTSGKWSLRLPDITSSHAAEIAFTFCAVIFSGFSSAFASAAAFLSMPKAWVISRGMVSMPTPISKFSWLLSVCAAQSLSAGPFISPIESCSIRYSISVLPLIFQDCL